MPNYDVICKVCGSHREIYRSIKDYKNRPECCGEIMSIKLSPPNVPKEFQPYKSMIDGRIITDRGEHRRHLKENNCIEVGNECMKPKPKPLHDKKAKEELRKELSQRLDAAYR